VCLVYMGSGGNSLIHSHYDIDLAALESVDPVEHCGRTDMIGNGIDLCS